MRCPGCQQSEIHPPEPCPTCGFQAEPARLEALDRLRYLLAEIDGWGEVPASYRRALAQRYAQQAHEMEVELGLRPAPLSEADALEAQQTLAEQTALQEAALRWQRSRAIAPETARQLRQAAAERIAGLQDRLAGVPDQPTPPPIEQAQANWQAQRAALLTLAQSGQILDSRAYQANLRQLEKDLARLAARVSAAPDQAAAPPAAAVPAPAPAPAAVLPAPAARPAALRPPLTWEQVSESLLSQRTLNALLFLGAGLLFAAAVSLVVWNWQAFPPWLQVTFLAGFTGLFYGLGWYVRARMKLPGSGLALSAVASLLAPLDFYAFYLSGGFPAQRWPEVWLLASLVCLGAYLFTVYRLQAEFFGYLAALALGSLAAALLQTAGADPAWRAPLLGAIGLLLAGMADWLSSASGSTLARRWRVLARPFWQTAVLGTGVLLIFGLTRRIPAAPLDEIERLAQALTSWLAGAVFAWSALRLRRRELIWAAALGLPWAAWLTADALLAHLHGSPTWRALGLAAVTPLYLWAAHRLERASEPGARLAYAARLLGRLAGLLALAAGLWALRQASVVAAVHLLLAGSAMLAARFGRRPGWLYAAGLLLLSAAAGWIDAIHGSPVQLGLAWALLAILHLGAAAWLAGRGAGGFARPLFVCAWLIGGLAVGPPLTASERGGLAYALGNWAGLNLWLAWLAHAAPPGLAELLRPDRRTAGRPNLPARRAAFSLSGRLGPAFFHTWAALLLLAAFYFAWTARRSPDEFFGLGLSGAAWALLAAMLWMRRQRPAYARPWRRAAQIGALLAGYYAFDYYQEGWPSLALLLLAGFYFAAGFAARQPVGLLAGGLLLPVGLASGLLWAKLPGERSLFILCSLPLVYIWLAGRLERPFAPPNRRLTPPRALSGAAGASSLGLLIAGLVRLGEIGLDAPACLWIVASLLELALAAARYAWQTRRSEEAHLAVWLALFSAGLAAAHFSRGSGRSAFLAALLAAAFLLGERALYAYARTPRRPSGGPAWRVFRRPLQTGAWLAAALTLFLSLIRNLAILGGGPLRERWSAAALGTLCGLFALGVYLYRRQPKTALRLAWLASGLAVAPWSLMALQLWRAGRLEAVGYGVAWAMLAVLLLWIGGGMSLGLKGPARLLGRPPQAVAHSLILVGLLLAQARAAWASQGFGLMLVFYLSALVIDLRGGLRSARFLYPAVFAPPLWALARLAIAFPAAPPTLAGLIWLLFVLPGLGLGRWIERRSLPTGARFARPFYTLAYAALGFGLLGLLSQPAALAAGLLFAGLVLGLSAVWFRQTAWVYLAAVTLPLAVMLTLAERLAPREQYGWGLLGVAGLYLIFGFLLDRRPAQAAAAPPFAAQAGRALLIPIFLLIYAGLPFTSFDRRAVQVGYSAAALLCALLAAWRRWPLLLTAAGGLALPPYWSWLLDRGMQPVDYGLGLWPMIAALLGLAHLLEWTNGKATLDDGSALPPWQVILRWWALPLFGLAYLLAAGSALLALSYPDRLPLTLALAALAYGLATAYFRKPAWLLVAGAAAQLALLAGLRWWGLHAGRPPGDWLALAFAPATWLTALAGLAGERRRGEARFSGWSRPLHLLVLADLLITQAVSLRLGPSSAALSLSNGLLIGGFASLWRLPWLAYLPPALGGLALLQRLFTLGAPLADLPPNLALLALGYGLAGYGLRLARRSPARGAMDPRRALWERPLVHAGWLATLAGLAGGLALYVDVPGLAIRVALGTRLVQPADLPNVQRLVSLLAVTGLFLLASATADRRLRLGYASVALLLVAWSLELLLAWGQREAQIYAAPAGVYLLALGYLERRLGSRDLARWVDWAAVILLLGASFWQARGANGGRYALWMGVECLLLAWWGSARRLRRFLYAGVAGLTLDVTAQLIEPLLSANRWIVFAVAGLILVGLAVLIERRLEALKGLSEELRARLEAWE